MELLEKNEQLEIDKIYKLCITTIENIIQEGSISAEVVVIITTNQDAYGSIEINTVLTNNEDFWPIGRDIFNIEVVKNFGYNIHFKEL